MEKRQQEESKSSSLKKRQGSSSLEPEQQRVDSILIKAFLTHILPKMPLHLKIFKTICNRPIIAVSHENAGTYYFDAEPSYENASEIDSGHQPKPKIVDNRVIIKNTKAWPSSVHGLVLVTKNNGKKHWGTGFLILNNVVLTAAHVLVEGNEKFGVGSIKFLPAFQGHVESFEQPKVVDYFIPEEWRQAGKEDYALLLLESPIGKKTGHFGLSVLDPESIKLKNLTITGYPADKQNENKRYELWEMTGKAHDVKGGTLSYDIFTYKGQSGSAVWYIEDNNYYVVGVHSCEDQGVKKGTWITRARYERMQAWIEQAVLNFFHHKEFIHTLKLEEDLSEKEIGILSMQDLPNLEEVYGDRKEALEKFPENKSFLEMSGARALAQNPSWRNLAKLILRNHSIRDAGVKFLVDNHIWVSLKVLDLENNEISLKGAEFLASSQTWKYLEELNLSHNPLQNEGISSLTQNTTWSYLSVLNLTDTRFSQDGAYSLATCENWPELRVLDISWNEIGDEGIFVLTKISKWDLRHLNLFRVGMTAQGARYLAEDGNWKNLQYLELIENDIQEEGAQNLARNQSWINLEKLVLEYCNIKDSGAENLAANQSWKNLKELILDSNHIEDKGAKALAHNRNWKLDLLSLSYNNIGRKVLESLKEVNTEHNFKKIDLEGNEKNKGSLNQG